VNRIIPYFAPVISGALLVFAFPGADLGFIAWAAFVPLLVALEDKTPAAGFRLGMASGFVFFAASLSWLVYTMNYYGGLPVPVAVALHILLSLYLALYFGTFGLLYALARRHTRLSPILFAPLFWVALELARNYVITGFPWNLLGYSQHGFLHAIQVADMSGVYGVSWLVMVSNAALAQLYLAVRKGAPAGRGWYAATAAAALVIVAAFSYGHYRLTHPPQIEKSLKTALVQGNIDQLMKWDDKFRMDVIRTYREMTMTVSEASPDLVVWPETAVPFSLEDPAGMSILSDAAIDSGANLMTGIASFRKVGDDYVGRNSAILVTKDGDYINRYDKLHLVPFGEYVPLQKFLPFVRKMVYGIGDFVPGSGPVLMGTGDWRFGTAICYEVIFPELVRQFPYHGADFLVSVTNDAWFGKSSAPYQHFNMAVFRAVENRRSLIRAANTGISGVVLPDGSVAARTDIFKKAYIVHEIPLVGTMTFYTRHGDVFAYLCLIAAIAITIRAIMNRRGQAPRTGGENAAT